MIDVLESLPLDEQPQTVQSKDVGVCVEFTNLPPDAHIDLNSVARMLNRSTKSVQRAVRRGDLPAPFKFLGKLTWLAGVIVEHLKEKQRVALQLEAKRRSRRMSHDI